MFPLKNLARKGLNANMLCLPGLYSLKKKLPYGYKSLRYKPEMVWQPSQVYDGNPYTNKAVS